MLLCRPLVHLHTFIFLLGLSISPNVSASSLGLLISVDQLSGLSSDDVTIIDARSAEAFAEGHIDHAYNIPFKLTYRKTLASGANKVAGSAAIQRLFRMAGVDNDKPVIVYGSDRYVDAARVFWVLEAYGHQHVSLLNGGFSAWENAGHEIMLNRSSGKQGNFLAAPDPRRIASQFNVYRVIKNRSANIVDVRVNDEYNGLLSKSRFAGHIPTAVNIPRGQHLSNDIPVMIKPMSELEKMYSASTNVDMPYITYCQNGGEAAVAYFVLRLLGKTVAVYDGSWSEWGNSLDTPKIGKKDTSSESNIFIEKPLVSLLEYSLAACQC